MDIKANGINSSTQTSQQNTKIQQESSVKFSDELKELETTQKVETEIEDKRTEKEENTEETISIIKEDINKENNKNKQKKYKKRRFL